jgi:uncharacterized OB-fold protein
MAAVRGKCEVCGRVRALRDGKCERCRRQQGQKGEVRK